MTLPVKALPANPWGLYEMHGNVWEWCEDDFESYPENSVVDPFIRKNRKENRHLVLRGGSWLSDSKNCRSAARLSYGENAKYDIFGCGFRLARGLTDQPKQLSSLDLLDSVRPSEAVQQEGSLNMLQKANRWLKIRFDRGSN